jgi:predicted Zn-dependent protease with MMP-like domain
MHRIVTLYRSSSRRQALWLTVVIGGFFCVQVAILTQHLQTRVTVLATALALVGSYLVSRLILGRIALDYEHISGMNAAAPDPLADEAFRSLPITVDISDEEFAELVEAELGALPAWLRQTIARENVAISIEDERPDEPRILGLYQLHRHGSDSMAGITLYRRSILRVSSDRRSLRRQIHDTLLHELGHLFGMSEADLDLYTIGNNPVPGAQRVHPPAEPG